MTKNQMKRESTQARTLDIIVVDDEDVILSLVEQILESRGHTIRTALSGEEALAALRERPTELVITDIRMPGMDGLDLGMRIRESFPGIRIALITGFYSEHAQSSAEEIGINEIVKKPFKSVEVLEMVDRIARSMDA